MGKQVTDMILAWVGSDRSKVSLTWKDPLNKSIPEEKAVIAAQYVTQFRIYFVYTKANAEGQEYPGEYASDVITVPYVYTKDWSPSNYETEWEPPADAWTIYAKIRIDINTDGTGDPLFVAETYFGDFIQMFSDDGHEYMWWTESNKLLKGFIVGIPEPPVVSIVDHDHYELQMVSEWIPTLEDMDAKVMQFSIHEDKYDPFFANIPYKTTWSDINYYATRATASARVNLQPGKKYYVKCRWAIGRGVTENVDAGFVSYWSDWSEEIVTRPNFNPNNIRYELYADTPTSAVLKCPVAETADTYTIEWAQDYSYFDTGSSLVGSNTSPTNTIRAENLDTGHRYYFRVKASNDAGDSEWHYIHNFIVLGERPAPPTTWTYNTSLDVGDDITFFWTHNSKDGSVQKAAQLYMNVNGTETTIDVPVDATLKEDKEYSYTISSSQYSVGAIIKWKIRTKGILNSGENDGWSDWSVERQIRVYARPVTSLTYISNFPGIIDKYPIKIRCQCGPTTLTPIAYNFIVQANQNYVGTTSTGDKEYITKGSEIYNSYVSMYGFSDNMYDFYLNLYPKDLNLGNDIDYKFIMQVTFDSGSSATDTLELHTNFEEDGDLILSLNYAMSPNTYSVLLKPIVYDVSNEPEEDPGDDYVPPLSENKIIDIYRKDAISDEYILISGGIPNLGSTTIFDPHPSLKNTTYRMVSTDTETGEIRWNDVAADFKGVFFPSVIIQWDENTNIIDSSEYSSDSVYDAPVSGNILLLPFNVKTSESNAKDVSHAEYIGRKHPVSYFGTQLGETASWSCEFDKTDDKTILMLRKLAIWTDNVYVREPSGAGYWATVNVSFNNDYDSLVIPVTIEVTRVEGNKP